MLVNLNLKIHLFEQFTSQGLFWRLARLDLTTGELPPMARVGITGRAALHTQHFTVDFNDSSDNVMVFADHGVTLPGLFPHPAMPICRH